VLSFAGSPRSKAVRRPSQLVMGIYVALSVVCGRLRVVADDRPAAHQVAVEAARESSAEEASVLPDDRPAARAGAWSARELDAERMHSLAVRSEALVEGDTQGERSFGSGSTAPILDVVGRCTGEIQEVPCVFAVVRQPVSGALESSLRST
jgi:hypothetical protein